MEEKIINKITIEIGVLGDSNVGKTSIVNTLTGIEYIDGMISTYGTVKSERKFNMKNNQDIKLIFWDSGGAERFRSATFKSVRFANGIILVFDLRDKSSFNNISDWLDDIKNELNNPFIILFGNKADLDKDKWYVEPEEINEFSKKEGIAYFEVSAKTGKGLEEGLFYLVNQIYDKIYGKITDNNKIIINCENIKDKNNDSDCVRSKKKNKK